MGPLHQVLLSRPKVFRLLREVNSDPPPGSWEPGAPEQQNSVAVPEQALRPSRTAVRAETKASTRDASGHELSGSRKRGCKAAGATAHLEDLTRLRVAWTCCTGLSWGGRGLRWTAYRWWHFVVSLSPLKSPSRS
uniref:Uncharacterized protein n=1 Tax=Pipistrellus kuhlii TaxID=59472 RepID=A0A7J8B1V3_PIPKU|nr:hypothetical protein mPipKuh1_007708 [Pipistrellus kuhlii]